jgi:hypothetical protein
MKLTAEILRQWRHQDPERLLQAALRQAQKLVELSSKPPGRKAGHPGAFRQFDGLYARNPFRLR